MQYLTALVSGVIFAIGLGISGMMDTHKVQGFLDLTGKWDPSLALVMGGAFFVTFLAYPAILKRPHPIFAEKFGIPTNKTIDKKLIMGGVLFGVGWAIGGFCPGPALANLATFNPSVLVFTAAMIAGWVLHRQVSIMDIKSHASNVEAEEKAIKEFCEDQCVID